MRRLLYLVLLIGITVQGQFTVNLGILASSGNEIDYSIANATYASKSFDPSAQTSTILEDVCIAGDYVFVYGNGSSFRYTISNDDDISTMSYSTNTATGAQARSGMDFNDAGTVASFVNFGSVHYKVTLSTAWDLSTATSTSTNLSATVGTDSRGWSTNKEGTKLWGIDSGTGIVYEFDMSPAWTGVPTYNSVSKDLSANLGQGYGMTISPDGKYMIIGDNTGDTIKQFIFGTIGNASTLSYDSVAISVGTQDTVPYGFSYNKNGNAIIMVGRNTDVLYQYNLNN